MSRTIEIPLKDSQDEVIELDLDNLPGLYEDDTEGEILRILKQERAFLHIWIQLALEYYKQGKPDYFVQILEASGSDASLQYDNFEQDQMRALDTLANYYVEQAHREANKERKRELFTKATLLFTTADKIMMYDQNHLLGRAYFCLLEGDKVEQADAQFNFVLTNQDKENIPALLGKACIAYQRREYKSALNHYKKCLKSNPNSPADIRLGIGYCFARLGKPEKARQAFDRVLTLQSGNVGALVGLAILDLNTSTPEGIHMGVKRLSQAYQIDKTNPMVLNHLANHFFFKQENEKVEQLALHAFHNTDNEFIRAESCYQYARSLHMREDYKQAFQYYYQATQFASPNFVLPHYGLGQIYIRNNDFEQATSCFEKVLKVHPNNYETMKVLGWLHARSEKYEVREKAKDLLKKVVVIDCEDIEAWIDYGQVLEQHDPQQALKAYMTAASLVKENADSSPMVVDLPTIYNNIGSVHYRLDSLSEAQKYFIYAYEHCQNYIDQCSVTNNTMEDHDPVAVEDRRRHFQATGVTIRYNQARVLESFAQFDKAEQAYKQILREHRNYVDCYLRLGCIARDRGQIYDASVWFKEALQVNQDHPDAWSLIGNLHMSKSEWGPGQKKFERILKQAVSKDDPYCLVALGNVWLQSLHIAQKDNEKQKRHEERALQMFKHALKVHNTNIWAANGIGCVLAHRGYLADARDIFAQVREATAEFPDVWINIAHIYTEQKQYVSAITMYENCLKKFYKHYNVEILQYLSRAYFLAGKLTESKLTLLKAKLIAPFDPLLLYNLAYVLKKLAMNVLFEQHNAPFTEVKAAFNELSLAQQYFKSLSSHGDQGKIDRHLAGKEADHCKTLLPQGGITLKRAEKIDLEEQELRRRQDEERRALRQKQVEVEEAMKEERRRRDEELAAKRLEYVEKTRNLRVLPEIREDEPKKKGAGGGGGGRKRRRGEEDDILNDSSDLGEYVGGTGDGPNEKRMKKDGKRHSEKERRRRKRRERSRLDQIGGGSDESEGDDKAAAATNFGRLSAKQRAKIKSREVLSSTSSSAADSGDEQAEAGTSGKPKSAASSDENGSEKAANDQSPAKKRQIVDSDDGDSKSEEEKRVMNNEDAEDKSSSSVISDQDSDDASKRPVKKAARKLPKKESPQKRKRVVSSSSEQNDTGEQVEKDGVDSGADSDTAPPNKRKVVHSESEGGDTQQPEIQNEPDENSKMKVDNEKEIDSEPEQQELSSPSVEDSDE